MKPPLLFFEAQQQGEDQSQNEGKGCKGAGQEEIGHRIAADAVGQGEHIEGAHGVGVHLEQADEETGYRGGTAGGNQRAAQGQQAAVGKL